MTERDIFIAALQKDDPVQRQAFLDEVCAGRPELRKQVEELLRLNQDAKSFLQNPAVDSPVTGAFQEASEEATHHERQGAVVGPYKLLEQIGEGGMGAVWMAQQSEPVKRLVALKLIKAGMDSKQIVARFEAERQALALMDHPNIARVLGAGATSAGRPYFVMDLVKGVAITRYCDEHRLTPRQRLELFIPVCQAVQHAHQKGVIHRDLKPNNVLVALYDGKPVPKVIDFGVAKATGQSLTDKTLVTGFGAIVGTLEYMSPEQAEINQLDIDTRSDIYSLGVLLYELLAGSPPFTRKELEKAGMLEMLRVIREQEPSKPSTKLSTADGLPTLAANRGTEPAKLTRLVRGELDWIVMKALEKDRNRRYETANGFAMDVERYLADESVQACPPSAGYRLRKFVRRNKVALSTGMAISVALVVAVVTLIISNIRIRQEKERAEVGFREARQAVDDYFTRVSESKLLDVPGLQPLRRELLKTALDYYQRFSGHRANDPVVQAELGKAHFRVGVITVALGSTTESLAAFEKARALQEPLVASRHVEPEVQADLAATYEQIGITQRSQGRLQEALQTHELERSLREQLVSSHPGEPRFRSGLASSYERIGVTQGLFGRDAAALEALEMNREIRERLSREQADKPEFANDLAESYLQIGMRRFFTLQAVQAAPAYEKARELREQIVRAHPGVLQYERDLAYTYRKSAEAYRQFGQFDKAHSRYMQARSLLEKLARESPTVIDFQYKLAECYSGIAHVHTNNGQSADAVAYFRLASGIVERVLATDPDNLTAQSDVALMHFSIGRVHYEFGDAAEGCRSFLAAHKIWEKLIRERPRVIYLRQGFAQNSALLGDAYHKLAQPVEARRYHDQARATYETLVRESPQVVSMRLFGAFLIWCPDPEIRNEQRAVALLNRVVELAPRNGWSWATLGIAHYRTGNNKDALAALENSTRLLDDGGNGTNWLFIAMAHGKLGHKDEARKWYDRAVVWMDRNPPTNDFFPSIRKEAAELLKLEDPRKRTIPEKK